MFDFLLTEEEKALQNEVREFVKKGCSCYIKAKYKE